MLNWWSGLRRDIEFSELGPHLEDVDASGVKDLFGGRDRDSEIGILGETRDEEHEAAGFDLHFSKIGAAGRNIGVFAAEQGYQYIVYRQI